MNWSVVGYDAAVPHGSVWTMWCSDAELKDRRVEMLDISTGYHDRAAKDYRADYDSSLFHSEKTGRGPLAKGWEARAAPVMCCYKVCRIDFKYWGMQSKVRAPDLVENVA